MENKVRPDFHKLKEKQKILLKEFYEKVTKKEDKEWRLKK